MTAPVAPLVVASDLLATAGTRTLLDGVSLGVARGDRIGVVGRNGGGKSTLLRLLAGQLPPQAGRVARAGGVRATVLAQDDRLPGGGTVGDVVVGPGTDTHTWAADSGTRSLLDALGVLSLGLGRPTAGLSGGERRRVQLAAALLPAVRRDADLVVLDEPTNHLDVEGSDALRRALEALPRAAGLVVVTHDRWFLDTVCRSVWEVHDGRVDAYEGGWSAYVLARAERSRQADAAQTRRAALVRKELAWLRRGPPARTSKPRYRVEAAEALVADVPPPRDPLRLRAAAAARLGRRVVDLEDVTLRRGGRTLLDGVTWRLGPGDRVALVGVNGAGKTSLLRLLADGAPPDSGRVQVGATVSPAHLPQDLAGLPGDRRVLEVVEEVGRVVPLGGGEEVTASALLERFGFAGAAQWTRVADLSGGERRRLQLLRLLAEGPNLLVLDEPTNDLDVDTLQVLEDLLDTWPGTLVVVSHDRWFLERTTDVTMALLGDGSLAQLPGGVEEYLRRRREARAAGAGVPDAVAAGVPGAGPAGGGAVGSGADGDAALSASDARTARKEVARLERRLARLEEAEQRLHADLAAAATDLAAVRELDGRLRDVTAERSGVEERWLELSEALEASEA